MLTYHNTLQQDEVVKDSPSLLIDIVANENGVRTPRLCRSISIMFFLSHLPRLFRLSRAEYRRRRNSLAACLSEIQQFETRQMPAAAAAVAHEWNSILLDCIRDQKAAPPIASRAMAITSSAVFEAVNAIDRSYVSRVQFPVADPTASMPAAAVSAAWNSLVTLFPARKAVLDARFAASIASLPDDSTRAAGIEIGRQASVRLLEIRSTDGADRTVEYVPGSAAGDWQKTPPAFAAPLLPHWGSVQPFVLSSGSQFRPPEPPKLSSSEYARDLNEVQQLGAANSTVRTAEQTNIAKFWASGPGTATPPGQWNMVASVIAQDQQLSLPQSTRMYAILDMALADAAILCWNTKFHYELWRPVTAIRQADLDGNDKTTADPAWLPLLTTPPFPTYTSGHSTFSAAGATVLAGIFGTDDVSFTLPSEAAGVPARSFNSFSEAAAEAGRSRIYGGIHFEFDNVEGQKSGRQIGTLAVNTLLPMQSRVVNAAGELKISGTAASDSIIVDAAGANLVVYVNRHLAWSGSKSAVTSLTIDAGNGDDRITVSTTLILNSWIAGGNGDDRVYGGSGRDEIYGGSGKDFLCGRDGDDTIFGGLGDDRLDGGNGRDLLNGGAGRDLLIGSRTLDLFASDELDRILYR